LRTDADEFADYTTATFISIRVLRGRRSLRVGTYRIIYQLADADQTVRVVASRHRSIASRTGPR
jgi:plasmid stabilization system protein ParE